MKIGRALAGTAFAFASAYAALGAQEAPPNAQATPPPSAQQFYDKAVEAMRDLPQPQYVDYTMEGEGQGLSIRPIVENHLVWLSMQTAPVNQYQYAPPIESRWTMQHRTNDYATQIIDNYDGRRLVSSRAFFDPTWYGAFRALRDGMLMYQRIDPSVSAYATPTPGPSPDLRTIAVVEVFGTNIYRVVDKGAATCTDGTAGHALHLVPRDRDPRHQLTDVVVNLQNMHFCTMRFFIRESEFNGTVEQHYSTVGGYWLQTDGLIETGIRALGIMVNHGVWRYRVTQMTFPRSIPAETFVRPYYQ